MGLFSTLAEFLLGIIPKKKKIATIYSGSLHKFCRPAGLFHLISSLWRWAHIIVTVTAVDVTQPCCYEVGSRVAEQKPGMAVGFRVLSRHKTLLCVVQASWNMMAHAQKPDFVFRRNGRLHLNRRVRQFSRLLAAEVCASAVVMVDTPCSEVVWRVLATHSIRQFPLHFPSRASPCAITFQLESTTVFQLVFCFILPKRTINQLNL